MSRQLEGKIAIVQDAAISLSEAIAYKFAKEAAKVVANRLPDKPVQHVAEVLNNYVGAVIANLGDVSEEAYAQACVREAR